jgi:hypothetical protein
MSDRQTLTEAIRDARAKALFRTKYELLTAAQKERVDELMGRAHKYAKGEV